MPEPLQQAVVDSAILVMETSAFMTIWTWSEEDGELPPPEVAATITFSGAREGRLTLRVASSILPTLSQNMLGNFDEGETPIEKAQDAFKEVLNMMCGNLLTAWYGPDSVFKLHPPGVLAPEGESESETAPLPDVSVKFCIENTICLVEAHIEGGIANDNPAEINAAVPSGS